MPSRGEGAAAPALQWCASTVLATLLGLQVLPAKAQQELPRVEVTGTMMRGIDAESALPVVVIRAEEIARSGATSLTDLMTRLPMMQGATTEAGAVGPATYGFAGVSIHNLGELRTLVLLNGHRLAPFGGQYLNGALAAVDLNAIPLAAIERIEILSDGASSLYGADAVGGVVNFITRRDLSAGEASVGTSSPRGGAKERRVSATKGFGSLEDDGFNVVLSFSHDERTALAATRRSYARSGAAFFSDGGKAYRYLQHSPNSIPANALTSLGPDGRLLSPYLLANGACPPKTFRVTSGADDYCGYDFVSDLEIYPERRRDGFMGSATRRAGPHELFLDLLLSRSREVDRVAPVPGSLAIPLGSALHDRYLLPVGIGEDSLALYRVSDLGPRTADSRADFHDVAVGSRGLLGGWDYWAGLTHSQSEVKGSIAGYPGVLGLARLTASGMLDPFVPPGQQTAATRAALAGIDYQGYFNGGVARLSTVQLRGSRELASLPAGALRVGAGLAFNHEVFASRPSLFAQGRLVDPVTGTPCLGEGAPGPACDQRFGDAGVSTPYKASRNSYGLFGELFIPTLQNLELGISARHDHYSDFGNATTAKALFRWALAPTVLVRGSVGSGFHAPTVPQVNAAAAPFGFTAGSYACSPELAAQAAALGAACRPGTQQYDQVAAGNPQLKPERSRQANLGLRLDPARWWSAGVDLWHVAIRNVFSQLPEQTVFAAPDRFPGSFTTRRDAATGVNYLAFLADSRNLGKSYSTGLDFDVGARGRTGWGDLRSQLQLSYVIREQVQLEANGAYFSAVGNNAELGTVTFRWQGRWQTTLESGAWTSTLGINFKSGYRDQLTTVDVLDAGGKVTGTEDLRLRVATYYTADLQTQWKANKRFLLTLGVLNVFDRDPPFSLAVGGIGKGQQFGYDPRYYDPRGRTFYANASYRF